MIKTPLSTVIGGAFWTPGATVINGAKLSFEIVMKKLFANGEQGFWYDPNDMGTMFQDAVGTTTVNATGQPVGLMLDKGKGLVLGADITPIFSALSSSSISSGTVPLTVTSTSASGVYGVAKPFFAQQGKAYKVKITWSGNTTMTPIAIQCGGTGIPVVSSPPTVSGELEAIFNVVSTGPLNIYKTSTAIGQSFAIDSLSIKELAGNHAYQTTSAARPILQNTPRRIDFDTVDDKLITTLPAQLTGCTVIRSVPNVGTQILTGQTIPANYEDNTDHCGLIVINRALTPSETSAIAAEFNKRAGV